MWLRGFLRVVFIGFYKILIVLNDVFNRNIKWNGRMKIFLNNFLVLGDIFYWMFLILGYLLFWFFLKYNYKFILIFVKFRFVKCLVIFWVNCIKIKINFN